MRKVIADISVSVDGFLEDQAGHHNWFSVAHRIDDAAQFLDTFDTLFCGHETYQQLEVPRPMHDLLPASLRSFNEAVNTMRKYVITSRVRHVRGNAMVIYQDLEHEVKRIRDEDGKNIWFCGGVQTLRALAALNLVDEYQLTVYPILLGEGKQFFGNLPERIKLRHIETSVLGSGAIRLRYHPTHRHQPTYRLW